MISTTNDLARATVSSSSRAYDPLAQFNGGTSGQPVDIGVAARAFCAFALLGTGVGMGVWVIVLINAVVFHPQTVGLLDRLAPARIEDLTLTLPSGKVQLPPAGMNVIGYLVLFLMTSIAARLVAVMIKHGVSLLRGQREESKEPIEPKSGLDLPPLASHA